MRKTLIALIATVSVCGMLSAGHADMPGKTEAKKMEYGTLSLTKHDVDVDLSGRLRQDGLFYDKIFTLQPSNDDQLTGMRTKAHVNLAATYGTRTFGKSAADAYIRFKAYSYWRNEGVYTPVIGDTLNKPRIVTPFISEAWVDLHFGTFFKAYDAWFSLEDHPVSLKAGFFPFELGRGISLGDFPMYNPYMGYTSDYYYLTRYSRPGVLLHGYINKNISYGLYYAKEASKSLSLKDTWDDIHKYRTDERRKWRGAKKDHDLFAAKMDFKHQKSWGDLHLQPYGMYVDASNLSVEFEGDSTARLGTVGLMCNFKRGRFHLNAEVAGQFGHQYMHAIDRNRQETYSAANGVVVNRHTHVFSSNEHGYGESKAIVNSSATVSNVNNFYNRGGRCTDSKQWVPATTKNGVELTTDGSTPVQTIYYTTDPGSWASATSAYNSEVTGNERFRKNYRLDYRGYMALLDMKYEFESVPVTIAGAAGYVSGDKYPFNEPHDKKYRGFLTYGDYEYTGKYVISQVILDGKKLPRPLDISLKDGYAYNNAKDMSNLIYLGTGVTYKPLSDKKKLVLNSNLLWYWQAIDLNKWNKEQPLPSSFKGAVTWRTTSDGVWYKDSTNQYHVGWMTDNKASRFLGTEINFDVKYRPVENCMIHAMVGFFMPGQLYKDLKGQPNENTHDGPKAFEGVYGLGDANVWRIGGSVGYKF